MTFSFSGEGTTFWNVDQRVFGPFLRGRHMVQEFYNSNCSGETETLTWTRLTRCGSCQHLLYLMRDEMFLARLEDFKRDNMRYNVTRRRADERLWSYSACPELIDDRSFRNRAVQLFVQ